MTVLVINSGSSSIKYQLFKGALALAGGVVERIGEPKSRFVHRLFQNRQTIDEAVFEQPISDHGEGMSQVFTALVESGCLQHKADLLGIGHRVVHGGEAFKEPTLINDQVLAKIAEIIPLAPLHNPANLKGIQVALEIYPDVPQVAVFDTAFHQTLPPSIFHYPLPHSWYKTHHIRRYGFHGTSHHYISKQAAAYLKQPLETLNLITLHLGNGASATAIKAGKSIDTSMGMTPLEGLMMGTRCGDIDPSLPLYLTQVLGKSPEDLNSLLNRESGLKGICGANDMRQVHALAKAGDPLASLAIEMYCYRIKKYIGAYYAVLGRLDVLIFTGGIGENDAMIRNSVCAELAHLGIVIDHKKNQTASHDIFAIQGEAGAVTVLVIPTDEELEIAQQTLDLIQNQKCLGAYS
ncbi:acetate/propionate family kinase [Nitrosococcus wardiae]|uniref:Acetate kinase n=1 Tax=Nitrosococcus wardiae TaxID=1814290 RepID=A0A4P7C1Q1_9GAMM|nr:acetate kinase [Nitrosococcus wardiae]QBQ55394.1 acetate kinase [Nitrosococcus wardiae]